MIIYIAVHKDNHGHAVGAEDTQGQNSENTAIFGDDKKKGRGSH